MKEEKNKLEEKLLLKREIGWDKEKDKGSIFEFAEEYKVFLDKSRTERLCAEEIVRLAISYGFVSVDEQIRGMYEPKVFFVNRSKNVALVLRGRQGVEKGINSIVSHIDSPSLHLKQIPLSEDKNSGTAIFRIHYYGGIKKYQWVSRPMALYGVVVRSDGKTLNVSIGKEKDEPVFFIPDLLIHLSRKVQAEKKLLEAIPGEKMNALAGSAPVGDKKVKERIKLNVLSILNKKYGIIEEDLISSELMLVPADDVRDVGIDRSMIMGYGHDDKSCAYTSLRALLDIVGNNIKPERTIAIFFFDKEEIGSEGNTSANSTFLEEVMAHLQGRDTSIERNLRVFRNSRVLSADVGAGVNPNWPEPHEMTNAAKIGYGVCVTKFTGSGGKYDASDANAEFVGFVRNILNKNNITWQHEELGKVDEGGGGTIAKIFAKRGMEVIDVGLPVLSMHAPSEIISKVDLYETYRFYKAFLIEG